MSKKKKGINKGKGTLYYNSIPYDSLGELSLIYYLEELQENGFIDKFERTSGYSLSNPIVNNFIVNLKTKSKASSEVILHSHLYTPDFNIHWSQKGLEVFCNKFGEKWVKPFLVKDTISVIEAKPSFDFNNMERLVKLSIKWAWDKYGVFIQIVKNDELFKNTFVPKKLLNKQNGQQRAFKYQPKTLEQYLKSINYEQKERTTSL